MGLGEGTLKKTHTHVHPKHTHIFFLKLKRRLNNYLFKRKKEKLFLC